MQLIEALNVCNLREVQEIVQSCSVDHLDQGISVSSNRYEGQVPLTTIAEIVCIRFSTRNIPSKLTMWFEHIYMEPKLYQNLSDNEKKALEVFRDTFQKHPTIQDLPTELLDQCITRYANDKELYRAYTTCKQLREVILGNPTERDRLFIYTLKNFAKKISDFEDDAFGQTIVATIAKEIATRGYVNESLEFLKLYLLSSNQTKVLVKLFIACCEEGSLSCIEKFLPMIHESDLLSMHKNDVTLHAVQAYLKQDLLDKALSTFNRYNLSIMGGDSHVLDNLVEACFQKGKIDDVLSLLEEGRPSNSENIIEQLVTSYLKEKKFDEIFSILQAFRFFQNYEELLGTLFAKYGDSIHALHFFDRSVERTIQNNAITSVLGGRFAVPSLVDDHFVMVSPSILREIEKTLGINIIYENIHFLELSESRDFALCFCIQSLLQEGSIQKAIACFYENLESVRDTLKIFLAQILVPHLFFHGADHDLKQLLHVMNPIVAKGPKFNFSLKQFIKNCFLYSKMKIDISSFCHLIEMKPSKLSELFCAELEEGDKEYLESCMMTNINYNPEQKPLFLELLSTCKERSKTQPNLLAEQSALDLFVSPNDTFRGLANQLYNQGIVTSKEYLDSIRASNEDPKEALWYLPGFLVDKNFKEAFEYARTKEDSSFILKVLEERIESSRSEEIPLEEIESFFTSSQDEMVKRIRSVLLARILIKKGKEKQHPNCTKIFSTISEIGDAKEKDALLQSFVELLIEKKEFRELLEHPLYIKSIQDQAIKDNMHTVFIKALIEEGFSIVNFTHLIENIHDTKAQDKLIDSLAMQETHRPHLQDALKNLTTATLKDRYIASIMKQAGHEASIDDVRFAMQQIENKEIQYRVFIHVILDCLVHNKILKASALLDGCLVSSSITSIFNKVVEKIKSDAKTKVTETLHSEIEQHLSITLKELFDQIMPVEQVTIQLWTIKEISCYLQKNI